MMKLLSSSTVLEHLMRFGGYKLWARHYPNGTVGWRLNKRGPSEYRVRSEAVHRLLSLGHIAWVGDGSPFLVVVDTDALSGGE